MPGSFCKKATSAHTSSSRSCDGKAGMPVNFMPCFTMWKSFRGFDFGTSTARSGGGGNIVRTAGQGATPGAPWQERQPKSK